MPETPNAVMPSIDVAGKTFSASDGPRINEVVVDLDLTAVDSCTITLLDEARTALDGINYADPVKVKAPSVTDDTVIDLFEGEVYALELESDERGTFARIVAFDPTYRLRQHRVTAAYLSMTDSDIATQLAGEVGLPVGTVDSTQAVHEHIGQINETHWDFLKARAAANDSEVFVEEGKLHFRKPDSASEAPDPGGNESTDPLQLTSGKNLLHVRTRMSAAQQVGEIEVRGWDPAQKKELTASAKAESKATDLKKTAAQLASQAGSDRRVAGRPAFDSQGQCDALAKSLAQRSASTFAYAEAIAHGDPRLRAGKSVAIGASGAFDGKYLLTRSRHVFRSGDYTTRLWVSGNHDRSSFAIAGGGPDPARWSGMYPALVTNLKDPEKYGRVKLSLPWLDANYETGWARVCQIGAGEEEGISWLPEVGDEVLVSFMGGDPRRPVVVGGLYNGNDKPPFEDHVDMDLGTVEVRGMQSRVGHHLAFHDTSGEERIEIKTGNGKLSIVLDQKNQAIVIDADGDVTLKSSKNLGIEATSNVDLKASGNISLEASGNFDVKAGGKLTLQGAMVEAKGNPIKLN